MADTALQVVQRVRRELQLDPTITSFSESDESNMNLQDVNNAYFELMDSLPNDVPQLLDVTGTFATAVSTRLYTLTSGHRAFNLLEWSFEDDTNDDRRLDWATLEYIRNLDKDYDTATGKPTHLYREGVDKVGVYPVPDGVYTINYTVRKTYTRLTATTDVFLIPDEWLRFVEKKAQFFYEDRKGFASSGNTFAQSERLLDNIMTQVAMMTPMYFLPDSVV